ncbi:MAG TPA: pyrimidine utilization protein D [Croceibacterium sp.]
MGEIAGLYYEERGADRAVPLILSAGLGGSASYWAPNSGALAEHHRVIGYDHRGTGRSVREVEGVLSVEQMADDIVALMDGLGLERAALIGHAAGGLAGLALALKAPERLARLVVVNGWAQLDPYTGRCFDARLSLLQGGGVRAYLRAQPLFLYPPQWSSDHHDELEREEEDQVAAFPGAEMIRRRIAAVRRFDIADRLGEITVPSLFLAADDDMLVPNACSERLAEGVPGATLARLRTGGHACNVTRPENFNTGLIDWLADLSRES